MCIYKYIDACFCVCLRAFPVRVPVRVRVCVGLCVCSFFVLVSVNVRGCAHAGANVFVFFVFFCVFFTCVSTYTCS